MNESAKTLTFVGAAVLTAALAAVVAWPKASVRDAEDPRGNPLFAEFDPAKAARLDILEFNEDTATEKPFSVAKTTIKGKTRWTIPSKQDYPTDAKDQLAEAAGSLTQLKVLDVVSKDKNDHGTYGVVDPDKKGRDQNQAATGVGTRVVLKDDQNKNLVALIIGKQVPGKSEKSGDLRFVRKIGEDPVYVVALKTDKLSTKFENWIEKDLLKLSSWDIKRLWVRDYSVDLGRRKIAQRGEITVEPNDTGEPKWKLIKEEQIQGGKWVPVPLAEDEELNTSKLDDMKSALGNLKIVDISPKPKGLSADLKSEEGLQLDDTAMESLSLCGFYPIPVSNNQIELFSNKGEVHCLMKDGVEYVLRFGSTAQDTETAKKDKEADKDKEKDAEKDKEKDGDKKEAPGKNRYLFVMAQFNPEAIAKPELQSEDEADKPSAEAKDKPADAKDKPADAKPATEEKDKPADAKPAAEEKDKPATEEKEKPADDVKDTGADAENDKTADNAGDKAEKKIEGKKIEEEKEGEKKAEEKKGEGKKAAEKKDGDKKAEEKKGEEKKPDPEAEKKKAEERREQIRKDNKRKQDEYEEKLSKGKEHVKELNARFADWYYVISDDEYRKIHLGRDDIFKKKEKDKDKAKDKSGTEDDHAGHDHDGHDHGDKPAGEKPAGEKKPEGDNPVRDFEKLKTEGPDGK